MENNEARRIARKLLKGTKWEGDKAETEAVTGWVLTEAVEELRWLAEQPRG